MKQMSGIPPTIYYAQEAEKYEKNTAIHKIERHLAERALELAVIEQQQSLILDIGCGSGLSGEVINELGHQWIGIDISIDMIEIASRRTKDQAEAIIGDIGAGYFFREQVFDAAISISTIHWLCQADNIETVPYRKCVVFFKWLYRSLVPGGRAALHVSSHIPDQLEMLSSAAMKCGFGGGVVVDYPNSSKAKQIFLCLIAGQPYINDNQPKANLDNPNQIILEKRRRPKKHKNRLTNRQRVLKIKARQRRKGLQVRKDTKYTGRKRKDKL